LGEELMAQGTGGNWNRDREKEVLRLKMELDSIKRRKAILETFSWKSYYYILSHWGLRFKNCMIA